MSRALWTELKPKWPAGFWDDWLREPEQRRGRACIRPEMNRVFTFGAEGGASAGQFYHEYLATIQLNTVAVDWQLKADLVSQLTKVLYARPILSCFSFYHISAARRNALADCISCSRCVDDVQSTYDDALRATLLRARALSTGAELLGLLRSASNAGLGGDVRLAYRTLSELDAVMRPLHLITDHKAGVPRGSYRGVLPFAHGAHMVYLYAEEFLR